MESVKKHGKHSSHLLTANRMAFLIIGCLEAAWSPIVPYVKEAFALDEGRLGLLMLCSGVGSVCALTVAGWVCSRYGVKNTVFVSAVLMIAALMGISMLVDARLTAALLFVFGACTILIDVSANVNGIILERRLSHHLMSGFHGGYSLGTLLGALFMSILFSFGLIPFWSVVITSAILLAATIMGCSELLEKANMPKTEVNEGEKAKHGVPLLVIVVGLVCFIMYSSEGAVLGWGAVFAHQERGIDMRYAGFFYTAFAVMMTITRFSGDYLVSRLGQQRIVAGGALLAAMGFALTAFVPHAWGTIVGFALVGLGAANLVPQLVSFAGTIPGISVQNAVSIINALGYSGILVGPVAIGFIAQHFGLETSFKVISSLCLVVSAVTFWILKRAQK